MLISEAEYKLKKRDRFSIKQADYEWEFSSETEDIDDDSRFRTFLMESFIKSTNSRLLIQQWEK